MRHIRFGICLFVLYAGLRLKPHDGGTTQGAAHFVRLFFLLQHPKNRVHRTKMIGTVLCMPSCGTQPAAEAPQELLRALLFKEPLKAAQVTERRIGGQGLPPGSTRRHSARLLDAAQGSRTLKKQCPARGRVWQLVSEAVWGKYS